MLTDILVATLLIVCLVITSAALTPARRPGHPSRRTHFHHRHS